MSAKHGILRQYSQGIRYQSFYIQCVSFTQLTLKRVCEAIKIRIFLSLHYQPQGEQQPSQATSKQDFSRRIY